MRIYKNNNINNKKTLILSRCTNVKFNKLKRVLTSQRQLTKSSSYPSKSESCYPSKSAEEKNKEMCNK